MGSSLIREQRLNVHGRSARVLEAGEGDPLVLLASVFIDADVYGPTMEALADRFRVIAVDLPGSGGSEKPDRRWAFADYADWVPKLLDALALPATILVGHSYSAAVALLAASRFPDRLAALVLTGAVAVRSRSLAGLAIGLIRCMPHEPGFGWRTSPAISWNMLRHPRNQITQLAEMAGADLSDAATRISVPTLVAWGRHDHTVPIEDARRLHTLIGPSRLEIFEGSHDWIVTDPNGFAQAVGGFVAESARPILEPRPHPREATGNNDPASSAVETHGEPYEREGLPHE